MQLLLSCYFLYLAEEPGSTPTSHHNNPNSSNPSASLLQSVHCLVETAPVALSVATPTRAASRLGLFRTSLDVSVLLATCMLHWACLIMPPQMLLILWVPLLL